MNGTLDPPALRRAMTLFLDGLRAHRDELNSLNVYPVPDGDTGTNLVHTQESVTAALGGAAAMDGFGADGATIATASLMGARGNSGVLLSQILRGFTERLPAHVTVAAPGDVAAALEHASSEAYRAVGRPAEGTLLSVLREASEAAVDAAGVGADTPGVVERALAAARDALARTREVNAALRRAGVVDAGGKGVVLLLDALRASITGAEMTEPIGAFGPVGEAAPSATPAPDGAPPGYEVQFLVETDEPGVAGLRRELGGLGNSVVVVGGGGLYQAHVHTDRPGAAVETGLATGPIRGVSVVYLPASVGGCDVDPAREVGGTDAATALVVLVQGEGLERTFASLGAVVVPGGPGFDPAPAALRAAIDAAPAPVVLILPTDPAAARVEWDVADESVKDARVLGPESIPAALAAAAAFNAAESADRNERAMLDAAGAVRAGVLIRDDVPSEGRAVELLVRLARRLDADRAELITLIIGAGVEPEEREAAAQALRAAFPDAVTEVLDGGQPSPPFLVGVE